MIAELLLYFFELSLLAPISFLQVKKDWIESSNFYPAVKFFLATNPIQKGFLKVIFIHIAKDTFISHHTGEQGFRGNYEIEIVDEDHTW